MDGNKLDDPVPEVAPEVDDAKRRLRERIRRDFTYHPPTAPQVQDFYEIRETAWAFASLLIDKCPTSRELSTALTKIEEAVMHANAAIARSGAVEVPRP